MNIDNCLHSLLLAGMYLFPKRRKGDWAFSPQEAMKHIAEAIQAIPPTDPLFTSVAELAYGCDMSDYKSVELFRKKIARNMEILNNAIPLNNIETPLEDEDRPQIYKKQKQRS